jgi:hypothetical protein
MFISMGKVFTPKRIVVLRVKGDGKINADTLDGDQQVRNIICQHLVLERVQFFVSCVDNFHNCRSWVSSFRRRILAHLVQAQPRISPWPVRKPGDSDVYPFSKTRGCLSGLESCALCFHI